MTSRSIARDCYACGASVEVDDDDDGFLCGVVRCSACLAEVAEERRRQEVQAAAQEVRDRLRRSGLPPRSAAKRLRRYVKQEKGETFEAFASRVGSAEVGLTRWNATAARLLREWAGDGSLLLVGPVGAGKSAMLASRVGELIEGGLEVVWTDEHEVFELLRDWDRRWDAIRRMTSAELLVIDDLGSVEAGGVWREDYEGVFSRRYNAVRPIAATSNRDLGGLAEVLGERVVSRLAEDLAGGGRVAEIRGYDWRTLRPHDGESR